MSPQSTPPASSRARSKLFGLFVRKERWGLSWRGWVFAALLIVSLGGVLLHVAYPFLAVTHRVKSDILVVEGWVPMFAINAAAVEFKAGTYTHVFTTGGPVEGMGGYINDYSTSASVGAGRLRAAGVPSQFVQMVPSRVWGKDRTYSSAVALRDWFRAQNLDVHSINVLTEDVHARRSRLLFQEAFGRDVQVGIIAVANPDYDARHWWHYSEGVREVISESIAYLYAKFLFWPSLESNQTEKQ